MAMAVYRRYCQTAAVVFLLVTVYTVATKLVQGRLADDWLHSVLHLGSGLVGIYAGWLAAGPAPARAHDLGRRRALPRAGRLWLFRPGLFLGTPFAIPLGVAENLFHLILSLPALAIVVVDGIARASSRPGSSSRGPRAPG